MWTGKIMFPQDVFIQATIWNDDPATIANAITIRPNGQRMFAVIIFVTVGYRVVGDETVHITHQIYEDLNVPIGRMVEEGRSENLMPAPFLTGEAD
jgi:hypothetical protein